MPSFAKRRIISRRVKLLHPIPAAIAGILGDSIFLEIIVETVRRLTSKFKFIYLQARVFEENDIFFSGDTNKQEICYSICLI